MNGTITILNKLKRTDSTTGLDVWHKTILENIDYYGQKVQNVVGTNVSMGQSLVILLPFNDKYLPYSKWKQSGNQDGNYTMSQGDYIIVGHSVEEIITPNNIVSIKNAYEPDVCEVRFITETVRKYGVKIQLKVEGV